MINANNLVHLDGYIQNSTVRGSQLYFNLKVKRNYKNTNDQSEKVYYTDTIPCKISGPSQRYFEEYLTDGQKIKVIGAIETYRQTIIEGRLKTFEEGKGPIVYRHIVVVETIQSQESKERAIERMDSFKKTDLTEPEPAVVNEKSTTPQAENTSYSSKEQAESDASSVENEFDADDYFPS